MKQSERSLPGTEIGCSRAGQKGRRKRAGVRVDLSRKVTVSHYPAERV